MPGEEYLLIRINKWRWTAEWEEKEVAGFLIRTGITCQLITGMSA